MFKKITEKSFYWFLECLPPCVQGKAEVICFLKEFDLNPVYKELNDFNDLFITAEGFDYFDIYGCKAGQYYKIGKTLKEWDTENFRYDDGLINMSKKIADKLKNTTLIKRKTQIINFEHNI